MGSEKSGVFDVGEAIEEVLLRDADSYTQRDPETFYASQLGLCKRQLYLQKLGLVDTGDAVGKFRTSSLIQEYLSERLTEEFTNLEAGVRTRYTAGDVVFIGRCSFYEPEADALYVLKARNGWYKFQPPNERHLAQLQGYLAGHEASRGKLIYVSKGDLSDIRAWPRFGEGAEFESPDMELVDRLVGKAEAIRSEVIENGIATTPAEIPYEQCGCFFCEGESLALESASEREADIEGIGSASTPTASAGSQAAVADGGSAEETGTFDDAEGLVLEPDGFTVPEALQEEDIWVVWDCEQKRPLAPWETSNLYPCKWAKDGNVDPRTTFGRVRMVTQSPIEEIVDVWPHPEGRPSELKPAILLSHDASASPFAVVDLDDVRDPETGHTSSEVVSLLETLNSYTEVSQSGSGFHVFVKGTLPEGVTNFHAPLEEVGSIEIYQSSRFIATTWDCLARFSSSVEKRGNELESMISAYGQ